MRRVVLMSIILASSLFVFGVVLFVLLRAGQPDPWKGYHVRRPPGASQKWWDDFSRRWGSHEPYTHKELLDEAGRLSPGEVMLDAGAHVGDTGLLIASHLRSIGSGGRVLMIEPHRGKLQFIKECVSYNGLSSWCVVEHGALGSTRERGSLSHKSHPGAWKVKKGEDFPISRLDDHPLSRQIRAMHLDVEGMEADVIEGSKKILDSQHPVLLLEVRHRVPKGLHAYRKYRRPLKNLALFYEGNALYTHRNRKARGSAPQITPM